MRNYLIVPAALAALAAFTFAHAGEAKSPYAGQETRSIKALSAGEIQDLLGGKGMGYAKAAELNRFPGPLHVIESARKINLTEGQLETTQALYREMKREAVSLGGKIVAGERRLDEQFSRGTITEASLQRTVNEIALLRGALRAVHLKYHLKMKKLLSPHQIALYGRARGYTGGGGGAHGQHGTR